MAASKSPQLRLFHIRDEIDGVTAAIRGVSFDQYRESFMLRRAAERAVQIVSEAAKALPAELTARYSVRHGARSSELETCCGMNTSTSTIAGFGKYLPSICRSCVRSFCS